jgi:hypothetical protein
MARPERRALSEFLSLLLVLLLPQITSCLLNLSPFESVLLKTRLEEIKNAMKKEYGATLVGGQKKEDQPPIDTFIFPGAGGVDELVLELQQKTPNSKIIDWIEHRGSIATAAFDGEAVGVAIAELFGSWIQQQPQQPQLPRNVHYIGISVGAFCANAGATTTFQSHSEQIVNVRLTLLDPFCGRGLLGSNYGRDHFGKYATTAVQLLNTDDPVPTTNDPLPLCYCVDVTAAPERAKFEPRPGDSMHSWPLAYFARHYQEVPPEKLKRGMVEVVGRL